MPLLQYFLLKLKAIIIANSKKSCKLKYTNGEILLFLYFVKTLHTVYYFVHLCLQKYYSLAIVDGKVEGRFSGGRRAVILTSKDTYNDGQVHNVAIRKVDRR